MKLTNLTKQKVQSKTWKLLAKSIGKTWKFCWTNFNKIWRFLLNQDEFGRNCAVDKHISVEICLKGQYSKVQISVDIEDR